MHGQMFMHVPRVMNLSGACVSFVVTLISPQPFWLKRVFLGGEAVPPHKHKMSQGCWLYRSKTSGDWWNCGQCSARGLPTLSGSHTNWLCAACFKSKALSEGMWCGHFECEMAVRDAEAKRQIPFIQVAPQVAPVRPDPPPPPPPVFSPGPGSVPRARAQVDVSRILEKVAVMQRRLAALAAELTEIQSDLVALQSTTAPADSPAFYGDPAALLSEPHAPAAAGACPPSAGTRIRFVDESA